jgi:hypothetical protein
MIKQKIVKPSQINSTSFGDCNIITTRKIEYITDDAERRALNLRRIEYLRKKYGFTEQNNISKWRSRRNQNDFTRLLDAERRANAKIRELTERLNHILGC